MSLYFHHHKLLSSAAVWIGILNDIILKLHSLRFTIVWLESEVREKTRSEWSDQRSFLIVESSGKIWLTVPGSLHTCLLLPGSPLSFLAIQSPSPRVGTTVHMIYLLSHVVHNVPDQ